MDAYTTKCPKCQSEGTLWITIATIEGTDKVVEINAELHSDGYENYSGHEHIDNEQVYCMNCGIVLDLSDLEVTQE